MALDFVVVLVVAVVVLMATLASVSPDNNALRQRCRAANPRNEIVLF